MAETIQTLAMRAARQRRARLRYVGMTFGRLRVVEYTPGTGQTRSRLSCVCSCGNTATPLTSNVTRGLTVSCGCFEAESRIVSNTTHGATGTITYGSYRSMLQRCSDPKHRAFRDYGGRGIVVCERWLSFATFLSDMGKRPSKHYSIDRYPDQNGSYEPSNCRWATREQQARNRRNSRLLTLNGVSKTIAEWSPEVGIPTHTISARVNAYGYTDVEALTIPLYGRSR